MRDIDAVRKRPGMYIGDLADGAGLHNMVWEVVKNAVNEGLTGFADRVEVLLNPDGSCTVRDNGRGIPVAVVEGEGISGAQFVMTRLHAFGRFRQRSPESLRGVGVCVVNALSEWLELRIWQDDKEYFLRFLEGEPQTPVGVVGDAMGKQGTEISFLPSPRIFPETRFNAAVIERQLREWAPLASDTRLGLTDLR